MESQISISKLPIREENYTEVAWHLAGLLVSIGKPTSVSELVGICSMFRVSPEDVEFLRFIPNSPLFVSKNGVVLPSMEFFSAVSKFFAFSKPRVQIGLSKEAVKPFSGGSSDDAVIKCLVEGTWSDIVNLLKKRAVLRSIEGNERENAIFGSSSKPVIDSNAPPLNMLTEGVAVGNFSEMLVQPLTAIPSLELLEYQFEDNEVQQNGSKQISVQVDDRRICSVPEGYLNEYKNERMILDVPEPRRDRKVASLLETLAELSAFLEIDEPNPLDRVGGTDIGSTSCKIELNQQNQNMSNKAEEAFHFNEDLNNREISEIRIDDMAEPLLKNFGFNEEKAGEEKVSFGSCRVEPLCEDQLSPIKTKSPTGKTPTFQENPAYEEAIRQPLITLKPQFGNQKSLSQLADVPENPLSPQQNLKQATPAKVLQENKLDNSRKELTGKKEQRVIAVKDKSRQVASIGASVQEMGSHKSLKDQQESKFPDFKTYIVEEEEGSGGYGTVYRARRKADGITFAIKCPHANAQKHHLRNEQKMLERFGGRSFVIKYEGSIKSGDDDCFILEHVEHDRAEVLKREINIFELQWYGYCLFKALSSLHKQGVFHRDVKPGNFLFSCKTTKGYLIDFNLAKDLYQKPVTSDKPSSGYLSATKRIPAPQSRADSPSKRRKVLSSKPFESSKEQAKDGTKHALARETLKKKITLDKLKAYDDLGRRNSVTIQGADGSGLTSKDLTSTRTPSGDRLREPLPCRGRKELINLAQAAMQSSNPVTLSAPASKRKRIAALPLAVDRKPIYITPTPLHSSGAPVSGAGSRKNRGEIKQHKEGPCVGTKGFRAPEVLLRSLHQGPKIDVWSAGTTLLYLITGKLPFTGDPEQNMKDIVKLKGNEDLWEVAKLHNRESSFPMELLDIRYMQSTTIKDWCVANTKRKGFTDIIPESLFDLIEKCLTVNPRLRITADEALRHDFFAPCHNAFRKLKMRRLTQDHDPKTRSLGTFHEPVGIPDNPIIKPVDL